MLLTGEGSWVPPPESGMEPIPSPDPKDKNVWLFDLDSDPNEHMDLSSKHPDVVRHLLDRLAIFNSTAVPCLYPHNDPKSNPDLHGGIWGPWED